MLKKAKKYHNALKLKLLQKSAFIEKQYHFFEKRIFDRKCFWQKLHFFEKTCVCGQKCVTLSEIGVCSCGNAFGL